MAAVVLQAPLAYEANPGIFRGTVPRGTDALIVLADGRVVRRITRRGRGTRLSLGPIGLPVGDHAIELRAVRRGHVIGRARVAPVYGLPRHAVRVAGPRILDRPLRSRLARLAGSAGSGVTTGIWVAHLGTARAASWNAGAEMPAASTLKLAILVTTLARESGDPVRGGLWSTYRRMVLDSSNRAANELIARMGGGSTVNAMLDALGATGSDMYGGYLLEPGEGPVRPAPAATSGARTWAPVARIVPPADVVSQPSYPAGKHTTAHDLGLLALALVRATTGKPPLARMGVTPREARAALWLLLHVGYPGLVDPATGSPVAHKAGWLPRTQHDAAIVFRDDGPVVVAVMSYREAGVDYSASLRWSTLAVRAALASLS